MEFIFELLFDIIVEGAVEITSHKKVPMPLRILAFIICFAIFGGLTAVLFVVAYGFWLDKNIGAAIAFLVIGIILFIGFIYMLRKTYKEHNKELEDETPIGEAKPSSRKQIIIACISAIILVLLGSYILYTFELF